MKINGEYYRNGLLSFTPSQDVATRYSSCFGGSVHKFQQGSAPAHRACSTVEMLKTEAPADFIPPDL